MSFFNHSISIDSGKQTLVTAGGFRVNNLTQHWAWQAQRMTNYLDNIFIQQNGSLSYTNNVFVVSGEAVIESDSVHPRLSQEVYTTFAVHFQTQKQGQMLVGLGECSVQGGPTNLTGIFVEYDIQGVYLTIMDKNAIITKTPLNSFNGDEFAKNYVQNNYIDNTITYCIGFNKATRQAILFLVLDGRLYLLHIEKPYNETNYPSMDYVLQRQFSFSLYFTYGIVKLDYADLLVSPYTYFRETTINIGMMPSPVINNYAGVGLYAPIVVIGVRASDRECVDVIEYGGKHVVARNAILSIIEYRQHINTIYGLMAYGSYGTGLLCVAMQGSPPMLPVTAQDRVRSTIYLPNNTVDIVHNNRVIKNVCKTSAAYTAEQISNLRTFCTLAYSQTIGGGPGGGHVFGHITIAEY